MKRFPEPQDIERQMIASLREKGYKLTRQRLEIIRLLSRDRSHPGAMEILKQARRGSPRISMSTVYYTLDMLKREGLIRELEFYDRDNRYDINASPHLNLVCTKCGKIEDFEGEVPAFSEVVEKRTGFKAMNLRFEYYGLCKECVGIKGS